MKRMTADERRAMPIGALARRTGVKIETIRYYERIRLLPAPGRSEGGHRLYGRAERRALTFVRRCRALGFSLQEIRQLLEMFEGNFSCGEVRTLTLAHLETVRAKLAEMHQLEATLAAIVAECTRPDESQCPMLDELMEPEDR